MTSNSSINTANNEFALSLKVQHNDLHTFPRNCSIENLIKDQSIFSSMIIFFILIIACVASMSVGVRRESWDESNKKGMKGGGGVESKKHLPANP